MEQLMINTVTALNPDELYANRFTLKHHINELVYQSLLNKYGSNILHGPYEGCVYRVASTWGDPVLKLLGMYESCLHDTITKLKHHCYGYNLIDLGCAEGYHANGLAKLLNPQNILLSDINNYSIDTCIELLRANQSISNILTTAQAAGSDLYNFLHRNPRSVLICDIEGGERDLFANDDLISSLSESYLVIEMHAFLDREICDYLLSRFCLSHNATIINEVDIAPSSIMELTHLPGFERFVVCCETRPEIMTWLYLEPIKPNPH